MTFKLDFPLLQSWRGTLANWQQKLKLLANGASIGSSLFAPQYDWTPEILAGITTAFPTANTVAGWYIQIPGSDIVMFQGQVFFTVTAAGAGDNTLIISLPRVPAQDSTQITTDFNQTVTTRFTEAGVLVPTVAVTVASANPGNLGAIAIQKTPLAAFGNGSHTLRYGGIYRCREQV